MEDPKNEIIKSLFAMFKTDMTSLACHMKIFDIVDTLGKEHGGWTSSEKIATALNCNLGKVRLVLRSFVATDLLLRNGDSYNNTNMGRLYLRNGSEENVVKGVMHWTHYATANNKRYMNVLQDNVGENAEYMTAPDKCDNFQGLVMQLLGPSDHTLDVLFSHIDTTNMGTAVDLGGGHGYTSRKIKKYFPNTKLTVVDLPSVVESAEVKKINCQALKNIYFETGDFFKGNLPKADCYILTYVLHDWSDEQVNVILRHVSEALPEDGILLVMEKILDADEKGPETALVIDMEMLRIGLSGKERTQDDYRHLFTDAGFELERIENSGQYTGEDLMVAKKSSQTPGLNLRE